MVNNGVKLGHPLGPDTHSIMLSFLKIISKKSTIEYDFSIIESGEGYILEEWPVNQASKNFGFSKEKFPSGNIKINFTSELNWYYSLYEFLKIRSSIYITDTNLNFGVKVSYCP